MTSMWNAPIKQRIFASRYRDNEQTPLVSLADIRWILRHKAYSPWYLVRYWRYMKFRLLNPHIVCKGMVFLGKNVEIHATPYHSRMVIGRWVHIGDGNALRCHEGTVTIGDKVVFGKDNVVNAYLDISIGASTLVADWCYICDFDHVMESIDMPIKDQGIVKGPVYIGEDTWIAAKVTVLRDTVVGKGSVLGAHAVAKGVYPDYAVAVGSPAKVVKNRQEMWIANEEKRQQKAQALRDIERKKKGL